LLLLNEFTALGRIPIVSEAMAYLPGYNVRTLLVIQAPSQLREVYGLHNAETMMKSVAARIVFAPKDYPDAREISDELGFQTVRVRSKSRPGFFSGGRRGGRDGSTTESQQARALMLPQEVKEIGPDQALIFYEGVRPIRCQKIRYYSDARFRARLLTPPITATPAGIIRPMPSLASVAPRGGPRRPENAEDAAVSAALSAGNEIREADSEEIGLQTSLTFEELPDPIRSLNFKHAGERPTDDEIRTDAHQFLETLRDITEISHAITT
jgi:type IV secretory pathway TraG/TraD family ATPase VirD4